MRTRRRAAQEVPRIVARARTARGHACGFAVAASPKAGMAVRPTMSEYDRIATEHRLAWMPARNWLRCRRFQVLVARQTYPECGRPGRESEPIRRRRRGRLFRWCYGRCRWVWNRGPFVARGSGSGGGAVLGWRGRWPRTEAAPRRDHGSRWSSWAVGRGAGARAADAGVFDLALRRRRRERTRQARDLRHSRWNSTLRSLRRHIRNYCRWMDRSRPARRWLSQAEIDLNGW